MDRACVRPGCDRPARARLAYDTITCQVWLDQLSGVSGRAQEICDLHAERLTVPRGWMLCDRRADAPALFVTEVAEVANGSERAAEVPTRRRRARRVDDSTRNLFDEIAADISEAPIEVLMAAEPRLVSVAPVVEAPDVEAPVADEPAEGPVADEPAVAEPAVAEPVVAEPVVEEAAVVAKEPEPDEELETLRATSPLLARAFRQTGPQRSVLTQSAPDAGEN